MILSLLYILLGLPQGYTFFPGLDDLAETLIVIVRILTVEETFNLENHLVFFLEMPATQRLLHSRKEDEVTVPKKSSELV